MRDPDTRKIVVIGPESTGKSTLCAQLAEHYGSFWCAEYAREFLSLNGPGYSYADLLRIANGQIESEENMLRRAMKQRADSDEDFPVFIDTDMYVMKVWSEFVFGNCHPYILEQISRRKYDLYLLCNTDLPWVEDELREYPDLGTRQKLLQIYVDEMKAQPVPWFLISGDPVARMAQAIAAVEAILH